MAKQPAKKETEVAKAPKSTPTKVSKEAKTKAPTPKKRRKLPKFLVFLLAPFRAAGGYIKGSWQELRQVFWPSRRATWGLTLAVILFTAFFTVLILALDAGFQALFEQILL